MSDLVQMAKDEIAAEKEGKQIHVIKLALKKLESAEESKKAALELIERAAAGDDDILAQYCEPDRMR